MSLDKIEEKIRNRLYDTSEGILQDMNQLVHNSFIYNGQWNKLTISAKRIAKIFKTQLDEIQTCPDCYTNYINGDHSIFSVADVLNNKNSTSNSSISKYSNNKRFWFAELCVRFFWVYFI